MGNTIFCHSNYNLRLVQGGGRWLRLPSTFFRNMKITINKKDFERVLEALSIAESSVKGTRSEEMFRLTRKKLKRQNK